MSAPVVSLIADEGEPKRTSVNLVADLIRARDALAEQGISHSTIIVHPDDYPALMELRDQCLSMDPIRGVACTRPLGHAGDHKSVGGFAWENQREQKPRYEGASAEDIAAVEEILGPIVHGDRSGIPCDDCGAKPDDSGVIWHNPDVEH